MRGQFTTHQRTIVTMALTVLHTTDQIVLSKIRDVEMRGFRKSIACFGKPRFPLNFPHQDPYALGALGREMAKDNL